MRYLFLLLALLVAPLHALAQPSGTVNVDAGNDGLIVAVAQVDQGAVWEDFALTDTARFNSVTTDAVDADHRIVNLSVHNTHATQTLYFLLRNSAAEAVAITIAVVANGTVNLTGLLKINGGQGSAIVSVRGSGANTTGQIIVQVR